MRRGSLAGDPQHHGGHRNVPILPSSTKAVEPAHGDPMDVTSPASSTMGPPGHSSPDIEHMGTNGIYGEATQVQNGPTANGLSAAAATSSQQPKVVQTAFIHKLYKLVIPRSILEIPEP